LVADLLDGKLEHKLKRTLGWRPEIAVNRDWWDTQDRFGVVDKVMDLQDVEEWTDIGQ
jgi:sarcosine oxidase/L-pipecolate oxidase